MPIDIYESEVSPCLDCEHKDRNKNDYDCVNCLKRLKYLGLSIIDDPENKDE